jgi:hypothetical protein
MDDGAFLAHVADQLGGLPTVRAVSLGGSRAEGTNRPDSDWDFSLYYRGHFDPQTLRDIGWPRPRGWPPRPHRRRLTRGWPPGASGSPTRRPC